MSSITQTGTREFRRMIGRITQLVRPSPDPPRQLSFSSGVLSWKPPQNELGITHYNIYKDTEFNLVRRVPKEQHSLADFLVADRLFLSSFNETLGLESHRVLLEVTGGIAPGTTVPNVSIQQVVATYEGPNDNGQIKVRLSITVTVPSPRKEFDRVKVHVETPEPGDVTPLDPTGGPIREYGEFAYSSGATMNFSVFLNPPTRQEGWRVYVVSGSKASWNLLYPSTAPAPSPNYLVTVDPIPTGGSGTEWAPLATAFTAAAEYGVDEVGGQMWRVKGTFTAPTDPKYRGLRIVGRLGSNDRQLSIEPRESGGYVSPWYPVPESAETWTIYGQSIGPNNRVNTIVPGTTPSANVTIQRQAIGGLKLNLAANFDLNEFEIPVSPNVFRMKIINADKVQTGLLKVGGGGNKPGQLGVFDAFGTLIAWAGQNGAYYGMWGKQVWVGGTDPTNAPFFVDANGNVLIDNTGMATRATFKLVRNGVITEIVNGSGAYIEAFKASTEATPSARVVIGAQQVDLYNSSGVLVATMYVAAGHGRFELFNSAGTATVAAGGATTGISVGDSRTVVAAGGFDTGASGTYKHNGTTIVDTARGADFSALKIGGNTALDASRNASVLSLTVNTVLRIDSSGNVNGATLQVGGTTVVDGSRNIDNVPICDVDTEYRVAASRVVGARKTAVTANSLGNTPPSTGTNTADSVTGDLYNFIVEVQRQINDLRDRLRVTGGHGLISD